MNVIEILAAWFLLSLTGALAPGPLSAAVVMQASRRGPLHGILPMVGHAIVEVGIVAAIILSVQALVLNQPTIDFLVGIGGIVIVGFGFLAMKDWKFKTPRGSAGLSSGSSKSTILQATLQGAAVSILSPYFLLWWFGIGLANVTLLVGELQVGVGTVLLAGVLIYLTHVSTDFLFGAFLAVGSHSASKRATVGGVNWINVAIGLFQVVLGGVFIYTAVI
jgi:threonine/homoserine/homoserine lactone efflux protein